jgi:hypothetical protein
MTLYYIGKTLQVAGLLGVGAALLLGLFHAEERGVMARELGGAAFGFMLFWVGRAIESR